MLSWHFLMAFSSADLHGTTVLTLFRIAICLFIFYTPGIYAEGYIAFAFPFVRSYVS